MTSAPEVDWHAFNTSAAGRPARRLVSTAISAIGAVTGAGRSVLDLGAGGGSDALEFARRGFTVFAYDSDDTIASRLVENSRMDGTVYFRHGDIAEVEAFPAADIIYSGYALPLLGDALPAVWEKLRAALKPGGVVVVDLFGEHDTWAGDDSVATFTGAEIDAMLEGMRIVQREIRDEDGRDFADGKKHWHVHTLVARAAA